MVQETPSLNLLNCQAGVPVTITGCTGGYGMQKKLQNLGLATGQKVTKVHRQPMGGPITVRLRNRSVVAVGRGMAKHITVETETS